jgi:ribosomal protein L23
MVAPSATKIDVKNAFKSIYGVEVAQVNMTATREKYHNTKFGPAQKRRVEKKAMVTLVKGQKIANFEVAK